MTINTERPATPEGVSDEQFQRAWDSLSEADRQVLLVTAKNGYAPKVVRPKRHRPARPARPSRSRA